MEWLAPAKVNLELRLLGRRPDGFHELDTTLLALDLFDRLRLRRRPGHGRVTLALEGEPALRAGLSSGPDNLAARAAAAVLELRGERAWDLELTLAKAIPAAAGLGGGSSDAAAAALGAWALVGGESGGTEALLEPLARLGSDCPFFAAASASGRARCRGRGERVEPHGGSFPWGVLVLCPDLEASTARVYGALTPAEAAGAGVAPGPGWDREPRDLADARRRLVNGLEAAALRAIPGLGAWRELLDGLGMDHARLAGSGSSFFALFGDRAEARRAGLAVLDAAASAGLGLRAWHALEAAGHGARART